MKEVRYLTNSTFVVQLEKEFYISGISGEGEFEGTKRQEDKEVGIRKKIKESEIPHNNIRMSNEFVGQRARNIGAR